MKVGRRRGRGAPRVSVVVPVYDVEDYVEECLESLLAQRDVDLEVIVVDDGSRDSSAARVERFVTPEGPVRLIRTANHGLGAARNEGIRHATGDYLTSPTPTTSSPRRRTPCSCGSCTAPAPTS